MPDIDLRVVPRKSCRTCWGRGTVKVKRDRAWQIAPCSCVKMKKDTGPNNTMFVEPNPDINAVDTGNGVAGVSLEAK